MKMIRGAIALTALLALTLPAAGTRAETFSLWVRSGANDYIRELIASFEADSEHRVDLQVVPVDEMVQKYAIASVGGSAPDALSLDLIYTPAFARAGQLRDLTDFAHSLAWFDQLSPAHLSVGTFDGRLYGLPFSADASLLIWNKELFKRAGLDPENAPQSWTEIIADARAVGALGPETYGFYFAGNCGGCNIFTLAPMIWAAGGEILSADGQQAMLDSPQVREAIDFYRTMVMDGLVPAGARTDSGANFFGAFANGNIGIAPLGSFAISILNQQYPDLDYGVAFLPGQEAGQWSSFAGGDNIVISRSTSEEKLPAIKAFIRHTYSLAGQKILARRIGIPVRADLAQQALEGLDPRYALSTEAMQNGRTPYSTVFNDLINSRNGPWTTTLNRAFFADSEAEVEAALAAGQAEMQAIIDAAR
ncbi:ABC transporter substrate-binding protein [Kushneria aurantia]|uniref:ABC transporter substrate-binding protein n=1 Tax=Kushneria aurantia TaxID=504092 RepID=A0ABV6FZF6_9GAMM|nr:sugar ABC transporter substrate-binding protein [Kushneria aurantia]